MAKFIPDIQFKFYGKWTDEVGDEYEGEMGFPIALNIEPDIIARRIKELRLSLELSQETVAKALCISRREYWRFEQPGYNGSTLRYAQIAAYFDTSLDYLFGLVDEKKIIDEKRRYYLNDTNAYQDSAVEAEILALLKEEENDNKKED